MDTVIARHKAFRALLGALAMPGTRHRVAGSDPLGLVLDAVYADLEAALRSGEIIIVDSILRGESIERARRGEDIAPERGATVFLRTDQGTPWTAVALTGPGIPGVLHTDVPFSAEAIDARARACADFPRGIDIVAIDANAHVVAVPRTTRIGVF